MFSPVLKVFHPPAPVCCAAVTFKSRLHPVPWRPMRRGILLSKLRARTKVLEKEFYYASFSFSTTPKTDTRPLPDSHWERPFLAFAFGVTGSETTEEGWLKRFGLRELKPPPVDKHRSAFSCQLFSFHKHWIYSFILGGKTGDLVTSTILYRMFHTAPSVGGRLL